jgi:hypothetical protein
MTLLEISSDVKHLADVLEDCANGELSPAIEQWMQTIAEAQQEKLDNYCALIRDVQLRIAARQEERERLQHRIQTDENLVAKLKGMLLWYFKEHGITRIETERYSICRLANGGKLPVEVDLPADELPAAFRIMEVKANKDAIRTAMEAGENVKGCRLLSPGEHVRIR